MTDLDTNTKDELDEIAESLRNGAKNSLRMANISKVLLVIFVVIIVFLFLVIERIIIPQQEETARQKLELLRSGYIEKLEKQKQHATLALDKVRASRQVQQKTYEQAEANRQNANAEYQKSLKTYQQANEKFQSLEAGYLAVQKDIHRARKEFALVKEKVEGAPKMLEEAASAHKELEIKYNEAFRAFELADIQGAKTAFRLEQATGALIQARARLKKSELAFIQAEQTYNQAGEALKRAGEVLAKAQNEQSAKNVISEKDVAYQQALEHFMQSKEIREQERKATVVAAKEHSRALEVNKATQKEFQQAGKIGYQKAWIALQQIDAEYQLAKANVDQVTETIAQSRATYAEALARSQQAEKAFKPEQVKFKEAEAEYSTLAQPHQEVVAANERAQTKAGNAHSELSNARDAEERQNTLATNATLALDDALKAVPIQKADAQPPLNVWEIVQDLALRVGSVVLVVYLVQILVSFSRYHYQINDCLSGQAHALQIAVREGGLSQLEYFVTALSTDKIRFGKMPTTPSDKMIDTLKTAVEEAMNKVKS